MIAKRRANMLKRMNLVLVVTLLASPLVLVGSAFAQKQPVPKPADKQALAEDEVKQLLLLMDTDKNGKISKQEWMRFMEAEFDRLDKNKNGELDVKEIAQSKLRGSTFSSTGK
jgi:Ca2+-binding EF-hand superfamily protein